MQTWKCRECGTDLAGAAHLRLGNQYVGKDSTGGSSKALCLTCVDKGMAKLRTPTTHEFVPAYVRSTHPGRQPGKVTALTERVRQLEELLKAMGTAQAVITDPGNLPIKARSVVYTDQNGRPIPAPPGRR